MTQDLLTRIDGPVAYITFNRPAARNAVNKAMLEAMREFLHSIEQDRAVRCIVLTGTGDHFMAGGDVMGFKEALQQSSAERLVAFEKRILSTAPLFLQLERMPQPLVVKVRGAVAGAALGFVAAGDFTICGSSAIFILSHVKIGASPDGSSSFHLPRVIGVRKAKELAILGDRIDAAEALALGLATRVVPDAELDAAVDALVQRIVAAPSESVRRAKLLMDKSLANTLEQQLQLEAKSFAACAATDDFVEGVSAFSEKRDAVFNKATR
jgi:2-(1,2-epoxy-1,2-dihydrophenyl)acetyl-CoA isomerase